MARYYAHITSGANVVTNFNPHNSYTENGNYLRLEYVGNITTNSTSNVYVWRQSSGNWFSFEQGTYQQYLNLGSTTYVTNVSTTSANRRKFNSDSLSDPAIFVLYNGAAYLTYNNWTTSGTFSGDLPGYNIVFFPSTQAASLIMDFYELKVYGSGDTLLFDFVPDLSGSTKGIRDKVSGDFFSATNQSYITLYDLSTFETDITAITSTYNSTTSAVTITADEDMAWTASTSNDWITLSTTGGTGSSVFTVSVADNKAYTARNGLVTLTNGEDVIEITVEQAKYPLLIPNENIYMADLEVVKGYRSGSTINKAYRSGELIYYRLQTEEPGPTPPTPQEQPLTFEIISGGNIVWSAIVSSTTPTRTIEYSKDNGATWTSITSNTGSSAPSISVVAGDKVMFRGDNAKYADSNRDYNTFMGNLTAQTTASFNVYGNIMSLINSTGFTNLQLTSENTYAFCSLFKQEATASTSYLVSAEHLVLPDNTAGHCYRAMFANTSLEIAPVLPATVLSEYCYYYMFQATRISTAPDLPATTLQQYCYQDMFVDCSNLTYIRCLATNISARNCTTAWVSGVSATGTFVTPSSTNWTTANINGIPSGWTRVNA